MATTARLLQSNFAAGEHSSRIFASGDLERYGAGLERAQNLLVLPLGAVERRSGLIWVEDPKDHTANGKLLPFVREVGDCVAVVVQDEVLRFIDVATRAYLVDGGGDPIEVVCPWVEADYAYLFTWQSIDVLWIGDRRGTAPVQVLKRVDGVWQALAALELEVGPLLPDTPGVTLTFGAATGAGVSVTASASVFKAGHDGGMIIARENTGAPPVKRWVAAEAVVIGDLRYNSGRVYRAATAATTGNNSPIHDEGAVSDGAVTWTFVHDGLGVARIVGFTDATHATVDIEGELPSVTSPYWAFGAFCDATGWPRAGVVHFERMGLAGSLVAPDSIYLSRISAYGPDYADFKPGLGTGLVVDSDAVTRALNSESVQPILHLLSFERLYAFTTEAVHVLSGPSLDEPVTPAGASARPRCGYGAHPNVSPVKAGDGILYVTLGGEELREIRPDNLDTPNASILADHISGRGFAELAFAKSPYPVCWTRLGDGGLACMTYEPLERVRAWAQQAIGGAAVVTSLITMPGADGRTELWLYVGREIDGAMRYAIEVMPAPWSRYRQPLEQACAVDAAGYFDFWNTNGANRARLTVIDAETRACRVETEADSFDAGDVGRRVALRLAEPANGFDPGARALAGRMEIYSVTDARTVEGRLEAEGHADLAGAWTLHWALLQNTLTVGARLEGCTLDALADGAAQTGLVVSGGEVTLATPAARGWIGLPMPFELIDLPLAQGPIGTAFGAKKKIERAWVIVPKGATPAGAVVFNPDTGKEDVLFKRRAEDPTDRPPTAPGAYLQLLPKDAWSETGQIGVRQAAPFPFVMLGIVKEVAQ